MTLKFKQQTEKEDRTRFFLELERFDLLESEEPITKELIERFIKKRTGLVKKLKNFRRSQNSKRIWKRHRFSILKGVRSWHKSLAGKRFHRQLGRFLATKITENSDDLLVNKYENLKALSSLKTHIFIELEYFRPNVEDDVELETLFEYSIPLISNLEIKLLESDFDSITEDELEIIFRLTGSDEVIISMSEILNKSIEEINLTLNSYNINEDLTYGESIKFLKLLNNSDKVKNLKDLMDVQEV